DQSKNAATTVEPMIAALTLIFGLCGPAALVRLLDALAGGRVVRGVYFQGGMGCLLNVLTGARTREERRSYYRGFSAEALAASELIVQNWDSGALTPDVVSGVLGDFIAKQPLCRAAGPSATGSRTLPGESRMAL